MRSMFGVAPIRPCVYAPTFHRPMSSPQITRMLGLSDFAIFTSLSNEQSGAASALDNAQEHRTKREYADQDERESDRLQRCVAGHAPEARYGLEFAEHVGQQLSVLP